MVRAEVPPDSQDPSAERFRVLAERELSRLYGLARRLVGNEAEDIVQECLFRAYRGFERLENEQAGREWLTSILVNCCRDHWRRRSRRVEQVELEEVDRFSLFRKIADEDPFPYSDSVRLSTSCTSSGARTSARSSPRFPSSTASRSCSST